MANILLLLLIIPFIVVMVWNGLHGKGYKIVFQPPPFNTAKGRLVRALMLVYVIAALCVMFMVQYGQATSEGRRGAERIVSVILFLLVILGAGLARRLWHLKK